MSINYEIIIQVMGVCTAIAIPGGPSDEHGEWPMYARATHKFFDSPWYSSVELDTTEVVQFSNVKYGEIRLLLHCTGYSYIEADGSRVGDHTLDLAFIRPYYELESDGTTDITQCRMLSWNRPTNDMRSTHASSSSQLHNISNYLLVDVQKILKVIHVVPYFGDVDVNKVYINKWKF